MKLSELCEQIKKDVKIDKFKITDEACNNAALFGEYKFLYHTENTNLFKLEKILEQKILERTMYYEGRATADVYKAEPLPEKIRTKDLLNKYLDADQSIQKLRESIFIQKQKVELLKDTCDYIKMGRGFAIKTALDNIKFENGL